jgi:hypothetical protein
MVMRGWLSIRMARALTSRQPIAPGPDRLVRVELENARPEPVDVSLELGPGLAVVTEPEELERQGQRGAGSGIDLRHPQALGPAGRDLAPRPDSHATGQGLPQRAHEGWRATGWAVTRLAVRSFREPSHRGLLRCADARAASMARNTVM